MAGAAKNRQKRERQNKGNNANDGEDPKPDPPASEKKSSTTSSGSDSSPKSDQPSPARFDGNRDPDRAAAGTAVPISGMTAPVNRNVDMGFLASAYAAGFNPTDLPSRPKIMNKTGRDVIVKLNVFEVETYPQKPCFQYDVMVGNGAEKRGLIKKCWDSQAVRDALGNGWIFDGNKIAWSLTSIDSKVIYVDLDKEEGRPQRKDRETGQPKPDLKTVQVRPARNDRPGPNKFKQVDFAQLRSFLEGKSKCDSSAIEAINFLDHLMRETPSRKLIPIKRNFYMPSQHPTLLGGGVQAFRGVYAAIRPVLASPTRASLAVNVDVANTAFWVERMVSDTVMELFGIKNPNELAQMLRPTGEKNEMPPKAVGMLRRMKRVQFKVKHQPTKIFTIMGFDKRNSTNYVIEGKDGSRQTVQAYFLSKYKIHLNFPYLPLVKTQKAEVLFPMELCKIAPAQRYNFKLSESQTTAMLNFAVTEPDRRWQTIDEGLRSLNWAADPYMKNYGLTISDKATTVKAKVLPPPKVAFRAGSKDSPANPGTSGRWDLRGDKKFLTPNRVPLNSWGIGIVRGRGEATKDGVLLFAKTFMETYKRHGGQIATRPTLVDYIDGDIAQGVYNFHYATGEASRGTTPGAKGIKPQIMFWIVPDKDSQRYIRIKKSCDCRFGAVSQVLQAQQVMKNNLQYASNVAMKVNAKLGGSTAQALGIKGPKSWFQKPTMIIGADVTHGAPVAAGGNHNVQTESTSIAAMTVSWDRNCIRYLANAETNGQRVEMIAEETMNKILRPMMDQWPKQVSNGVLPQHVIYMRDGVSEGQYMQVLDQELADMKTMFRAINPQHVVKFTVIVATKRHHIRFFPQQGAGDKKNNPLPGTLVESGCTHPFEYDFYLCSHSAIKGTARPVHYYVLKDEAGMAVEDLQNMIYEASYQYVRSTTPISMYPAIYYAHLAAARAISHLDVAAVSSGGHEGEATRVSGQEDTKVAPLVPMQADVASTMWYV